MPTLFIFSFITIPIHRRTGFDEHCHHQTIVRFPRWSGRSGINEMGGTNGTNGMNGVNGNKPDF